MGVCSLCALGGVGVDAACTDFHQVGELFFHGRHCRRRSAGPGHGRKFVWNSRCWRRLPFCADGAHPAVGLIQAINGGFYGTTSIGGRTGCGAVFAITPNGTLTTIYTFPCAGGPAGELIQPSPGDLYGTTIDGGSAGTGTIFKITPSGTLTTLYTFCLQGHPCPDGGNPYSALVQATDGNFYGTTLYGGVGGGDGGGTVFKITPSGTLTTLYRFCPEGNPCRDGVYPYAGLVQATNGIFYGATQSGGAEGFGTVFSLSVGLGPFVKTQPAFGQVGAAIKILGTDMTGVTA